MWERLFDICFIIHTILTFFTAYQHDLEWIVDPIDIAINYSRSSLLFDVLSTLPCIVLNVQSESWVYWLKLLRFVHFGKFLKLMDLYFQKMLLRIGIDKQAVERTIYFITLILYLVYVIHILSCSWTLIGYMSEGSWISVFQSSQKKVDDSELGKGSGKQEFSMNNIAAVYVRAVYFIVTSLTTVGYGDFKGSTTNEFLFQMALEFIGIAFFSLLMGSINNILVQESKLSDIMDEKIEELEVWLRKLDTSRGSGKNLPKTLYDSIKNYVEASFLLDFSQI